MIRIGNLQLQETARGCLANTLFDLESALAETISLPTHAFAEAAQRCFGDVLAFNSKPREKS